MHKVEHSPRGYAPLILYFAQLATLSGEDRRRSGRKNKSEFVLFVSTFALSLSHELVSKGQNSLRD